MKYNITHRAFKVNIYTYSNKILQQRQFIVDRGEVNRSIPTLTVNTVPKYEDEQQTNITHIIVSSHYL